MCCISEEDNDDDCDCDCDCGGDDDDDDGDDGMQNTAPCAEDSALRRHVKCASLLSYMCEERNAFPVASLEDGT